LADVFLSYAREDRHRVSPLVDALADKGWSVWWDQSLDAGVTYREAIQQELLDARCVLVVWSKRSIGSSWVQEEAEEGLRRGVLVPVLIDDVVPPLGLRSVQAVRLLDESASTWGSGIADVVRAIDSKLALDRMAEQKSGADMSSRDAAAPEDAPATDRAASTEDSSIRDVSVLNGSTVRESTINVNIGHTRGTKGDRA
jgi:hypothetical protein